MGRGSFVLFTASPLSRRPTSPKFRAAPVYACVILFFPPPLSCPLGEFPAFQSFSLPQHFTHFHHAVFFCDLSIQPVFYISSHHLSPLHGLPSCYLFTFTHHFSSIVPQVCNQVLLSSSCGRDKPLLPTLHGTHGLSLNTAGTQTETNVVTSVGVLPLLNGGCSLFLKVSPFFRKGWKPAHGVHAPPFPCLTFLFAPPLSGYSACLTFPPCGPLFPP